MKMYTSPLRRLAHIPLVTMPLRPLKLLRISTGLLYSQYFMPLSRLNIARRYYLPQMRRGHIPLDAHCRTTGRSDLYRQKALRIYRLLLLSLGLLGQNRLSLSRTRHHRDKPGRDQRQLVLFTIFALPPIVLVSGYSVSVQIVLLADVLLLSFPVDCSDFLSCHHKISFFCKGSPAHARLQYAFHRRLT